MEHIDTIWRAISSLARTFMIVDVLDIGIVSFLIYNFIKIIRESRAEQLIKGILMLIATSFVAFQLHFRMLSTILDKFFQYGVLALLVVFQPELRKALEHIGRSSIGEYWDLGQFFGNNDFNIKQAKKTIKIVAEGVFLLKEHKTGALIVFEKRTKLGDIINTGTIIKAQPSVEILANIFYDKAPLHDGAIIIKSNLIYSAGCILPLTKNENLSNDYGTRHRAGIGVTESSDAISIVVSEETGRVSLISGGIIKYITNYNALTAELEKHLIVKKNEVEN